MIKYLLVALTIAVVSTNGFELKSERTDLDFKETSTHLINRLVNILRDAFEKGIETYDKVVNDEDVKGILEHLGPLKKKIAMSIINGFRNLLDTIDRSTKGQEQLSKRGIKESSAQLINKLVNILKIAFVEGQEAYEKVINDEDVQGILSHLGPLSRKIAESIIQGYKDLLDKIDNATKDQAQLSKRGETESSEQLIYELVSILTNALEEGREAYEKVIGGEDVQRILSSLDSTSRRFADSMVQGLKDLLDKIDNGTKDQTQLNKRGGKESSEQLIYELVTILSNAFDQGREAFEKVIVAEDLQSILSSLDSTSRRFADSMIQGFKDLLDKDETQLNKRDFKETSASLINKLVKLLKRAFEEGREAYDKVINDEDVKAILNHLGPLSRRVAESIIQGFKDMLEKIDNATGGKSLTYKRGLRESSAQLINKLVHILRNAFKEGREAYEKVINDEDVQGILSHLGPLSRKIADSMIQGFKDLLDKIDNATKDQSLLYKRDFKESSKELINKLVTILKKAFEEGREAFEKVLNDEDVQGILAHLGPLSRKFAEFIIQGFKDLLDKIDNATKSQDQQYKRDFGETSASLINKLVKILKKGFEEGREAYEKVINDEDVKAILNHLGPLSRRVAESIIQGFKNTLEMIDKATNDSHQSYKRDVNVSTAQLINKLEKLLKTGFKEGRESFDKVLKQEDMTAIINTLEPDTKEAVTSIVKYYGDMVDQIERVVKAYSKK